MIAKWTDALDRSRDRLLAEAREGRHGAAVLAHAAAGRVVAAWTLDPADRDPAVHVARTHERGRRHLRRLLDLPPGVEVRSPMTNELFVRLTEPAGSARRAAIDYTAVEAYTYTPRKPLRRVLDHALDHLEQLEQWRRWRRDGVVPTPTDGWVPSTVTVAEDRLPLTAADLDGWLWRIDQAVRLLAQRAAALSADELDWQPPDGGWPLRRVLHHVARSEILYASAFDEALPEDPEKRYVEAAARLGAGLAPAGAAAGDPAVVFPDPYGTFRTPGEVVGEVVALEEDLIRTAGRGAS